MTISSKFILSCSLESILGVACINQAVATTPSITIDYRVLFLPSFFNLIFEYDDVTVAGVLN